MGIFQLNRSAGVLRRLHNASVQKRLTARSDLAWKSARSLSAKTWPSKMIESNGDYRDEQHIERLIGGPLYQHQHTIPRLPVPSIEDTIQRFLPTALPLARTTDEQQALKQACHDFPQQAQQLQQRLIQRREDEGNKDSSWLQMWWNQMGYLQVRDPVVVNVSYFFHFLDDPTLHYTACNSNISSNISSNVSSSAKVNVQRGAALLYSTAEFRKMVCTGQLTAEVIGSKTRGNQAPLCSVAYKYMFNSCRVPQRQQDAYRMYDPSQHTHSIVSRKGYFFSIELVDGESQDPLPIEVLEAQLERCIEMADDLSCVGASDMSSDMALDVTSDMASGMALSLSPRAKLGLLTSQNRDDWADGRQQLLDIGGDAFGKDLERLESGAILLNLDDHSPVSRQECGEMCWTGGMKGGHNRWFDKSIQVCVSENGKSGFLGEHSMMDGMPCVRYADYITGVTYAEAKRRSHAKYDTETGASSSLMMDVSSMVNELFGEILSSTHGGTNGVANGANSASSDSKMIVDLVDVAQASFYGLIKSHDLHVQSFHGYGSGWMKKNGFSPDAFVQAAMQVASFRLFGEMVGTYEATQVRRFLHGRTETTRTVSRSMETFVKMMGTRCILDGIAVETRQEQLEALRAAAKEHSAFIRLAADAEGVDRHFFGLSMLGEPEETLPDLFQHPAFQESKKWRMSTSHLPHPRFANWGFGAVVPDGVGIGYSILPDCCTFNVSAYAETEWADKMSTLLEEALVELKAVVESDPDKQEED